MKKKVIFAALAAVAILSGYMGYISNSMVNEPSNLALSNVEAEAGWFESYWNRPDYNCESITCYYLLVPFESTIAKFVGEGCGTEPHSWCCPGCNY